MLQLAEYSGSSLGTFPILLQPGALRDLALALGFAQRFKDKARRAKTSPL